MERPSPAATLVYSCSGSSNVAQLANYIAVRLDRLGISEMSCIAGVGGDVRALVKKATAGRPVLAIDGCPLTCCKEVLAAKGVEPVHLIRLHDLGLKKRQHVDFDADERELAFRRVLEELAPILIAEDPSLKPRIAAALAGSAPAPDASPARSASSGRRGDVPPSRAGKSVPPLHNDGHPPMAMADEVEPAFEK